MSQVYEIIKRPLVTEKVDPYGAADAAARYAFEVSRSANKHAIRAAVEQAFGVKVASVNTMMMHGKEKRFGRSTGKRPSWKKAIVTLREGHSLDLFADMSFEDDDFEEDDE